MVDKDKNNEIDPFDEEEPAASSNGNNNAGKKEPSEDKPSDFDDQFAADEINTAETEDIKESEEIDSDVAPEVATSPRKNFLMLAGIIGVGLIVIFSFIFGSDSSQQTDQQQIAPNTGMAINIPATPPPIDFAPKVTPDILPPPTGGPGGLSPELPSMPGSNSNPGTIPGDNLPPPPGTVGNTGTVPGTPTVPGSTPEPSGPVPPPLPELPGGAPPLPGGLPDPGSPDMTPEQKQALDQKIKSNMLIFSGAPEKPEDPNRNTKPEEESVKKAKLKKIGDPSVMIAQGKIIDAILETAINTDLPGVLRAIVSRDIYSESGKNILIPKGSRLIGSYNSDVKRGQARVYAVWNRIITPDGYEVMVQSPGIDQIGRTGFRGEVDNHYIEIVGNSILFSALSVGFAGAAESITGSQGVQTTQNANGSTTTSGTGTDVALQEAITNFGATVKGLGADLLSVRPTVTVDQGTRMKVFVNKDLVFESEEKAENNTPGGLFQ